MLGEGELGFPTIGSFDRRKLLEILIDVFKYHAAGRLTLRQGKSERRIYFLNGYPVWARSEDEAELLGEVLVKLDLITAQQKEACLALAERDGIMFRDAVIRAGHLDEGRLFRAERERVHRIVVQTFEWAAGEYEFTRRDDFVDRVGVFEVNPVVCFVEAVRRFLSVNELAADIEPRNSELLVEGSHYRRLVGYLKLPVEVGALLECMAGDTSVGTLFQRFCMAREALIKNLWIMFSLGIADTIAGPEQPTRETPVVDAEEPAEATHHETGFMPSLAEFELDMDLLDDEDQGHEPEISDYARSIVTDYVVMMAGTYYDVLGLTPEAEPVDVDRAWLRARGRFDVRKLEAGDPSEVREKAKTLMDRAETAWRTLRDRVSKAEYDRSLSSLDSGDFVKPG